MTIQKSPLCQFKIYFTCDDKKYATTVFANLRVMTMGKENILTKISLPIVLFMTHVIFFFLSPYILYVVYFPIRYKKLICGIFLLDQKTVSSCVLCFPPWNIAVGEGLFLSPTFWRFIFLPPPKYNIFPI